MDVIEIVKRKVINKQYSESRTILHPVLSFYQCQTAHTTLVKFKETSNHNEYICYGNWGQTNKMYCINIDNVVYIFTTIENINENNFLEMNSMIGQLFIMDDEYLQFLKNS